MRHRAPLAIPIAMLLGLVVGGLLWPPHVTVRAQGQNFGNSVSSLGWGPGINNVTVGQIHIEDAGSGNIDLMAAIPVGSRALAFLQIYNTAGTTTTWYTEAKLGSTYYRIGPNSTTATNVAININMGGLILEAGNLFSLNTSQAGLNIFGTVLYYPTTEKLRSIFSTSLGSGNNTIYTCCGTGKTAFFASGNSQWLGTSNDGYVAVINATAGSLNYNYNLVKSGGTVGTSNQASPNATAVGTGVLSYLGNLTSQTMLPGDFVNVNSSGAGAQYAWITVFEQ